MNFDGMLTGTGDVNASRNVIERLANAETITLTKKVMTFHDVWKVEVDGEEVGKVEGKYVRVIGNMWLLTDKSGNLVDAANKDILTLSHQSNMYDYNGDKRGAMRDKIISIGHLFTSEHIEAKQNIVSLTMKFSVKSEGATLSVRKDLRLIQSVIRIQPNGASKLATLDTIWVAIITNQIESDS